MVVIAQKVMKEIREQTQLNDHGEAYLMAANALGCTKLAEQFGRINQRQRALGELPHNLYCERHRLYDELMAQARTLLSPEGYKALQGSL